MSDWQEITLGEISSIEIGGTPSRSEERYWWKSDNDGIRLPWVSISDMKGKVITDTKESITEIGALQSNCKHVPKGTLLMSFKLTIGRLAFAGRDLYTNEAITAIRPNKDLCPEFLYYGLQHWNLTGDSDQAVKGVTLNKQKLQEIPCLIPPLPEQKKIAEILSGIDLAISGVQRKIEKLRSARVALVESELRGDRQTNFADTEIGITPSHWKVKGILEVSSVASGQVDPTTKNYQDMILIAPNHIESGTGKVIGKETAIQQGAISGKYFAKKGSVILSKIRPNLAKVCMADHDCLTSADMYPITAGHEITPGYLKQVLLSKRFTQYATESSVRGNIPKINREELSGYKFGMPPLDEQEAIVSSIESVEQTISIEESRVCLLLALKNSLSSELLSGRKRVSDARVLEGVGI